MSSVEQFRRAMADQAAPWQPTEMEIRVVGPCPLPGCPCGLTGQIELTVGGYVAAFLSAEEVDRLADAIAQCRAEIWGPRSAAGGGG